MKQAAFLALLLFATQNLCAQQESQEPSKPAPAVNAAESAPPNDVAKVQTPASAPKLGHPLDPADVDILTGKADRAARGYTNTNSAVPYTYGYGYGGTSYGFGQTQSGPSLFAPVSTATSPPFVPLAFGRVGNRSFAVFGSTIPFAPLFFTPGRFFGSTGTFFFIH
jgi:hypothetical protein